MWSLDELPSDLAGPAEDILAVPGIGSGVLRLIDEFRSSGEIAVLDRLENLYPRDVARLRKLPRMTPALLRSLKGELGVDRAGDLIAAVDSGAVETLKGVGPTTAERWARALELAPSAKAVPAFEAAALAGSLDRHLTRHQGGKMWVAGAVRRLEEWVDAIDLVAEVEDPIGTGRFLEETAVARFRDQPGRGIYRLESHDGVEVRVHLARPGAAGTRLIEATGPPDHAATLLAGIEDATLSEAEVYARQGRAWIPAPARGLPERQARDVVRSTEIRGDLHIHTERSPDGRMSLADMLTAAVDLGYEYVLITDHTSGLRFGGLDEQGLLMQRAEIDSVRGRFPDLLVLHGAELNIDRDGGLDIGDEGLALLDLAVAGLHSHFDLGREEQTARVITALRHPVVRILAHPTGRRIGIRPAVDLDVEAVIAAAVDHGVALEVNGHRDRLDLSADHATAALSAGAMLAANSDAHRMGELGNVANSVGTLQRAGVPPASVVNTLSVARFRDWISGVARFPTG